MKKIKNIRKINKTFMGCKFVTESCILLNLSINTRYLSLLLLHSYIKKYDLKYLCIASLLMASKLEEQDCSLKRIIYVITYLYTEYELLPEIISYDEYIQVKEKVIFIELEILKDNNFVVAYEDLFIKKESSLSDKELLIRLNSILFYRKINTLSVQEIHRIVENDDEFYKRLKDYKGFESKKICLKTFKDKENCTRLNSNLISKFLKK